jgi:AraC-like DNA-binding protein
MPKNVGFVQIIKQRLTSFPDKALLISTDCPFEKVRKHALHAPRIVFLLSGRKHYWTTSKHGRRQTELYPETPLYVAPHGLLMAGTLTEYDMISVVYQREFIRFVRITNHRLTGLPPTQPDVFHHTSQPLSLIGKAILRVLNQADHPAPATRIALYRALLSETVETLEGDSGVPSRSWQVWSQVKNAIQENLYDPNLSRASVAASFNLTPSYVSQLFQKHDHNSFNACVTQERISLGTHLLQTTEKPQKEIAALCGFRSTGYFIKVFKKIKGQTPAAFRLAISKQ